MVFYFNGLLRDYSTGSFGIYSQIPQGNASGIIQKKSLENSSHNSLRDFFLKCFQRILQKFLQRYLNQSSQKFFERFPRIFSREYLNYPKLLTSVIFTGDSLKIFVETIPGFSPIFPLILPTISPKVTLKDLLEFCEENPQRFIPEYLNKQVHNSSYSDFFQIIGVRSSMR